MPPADGSSTQSGFTFVRGRIRSPHMAKLQAATAYLQPTVAARLGLGQTGRETGGSRYRLMPPPRRGQNNRQDAVV